MNKTIHKVVFTIIYLLLVVNCDNVVIEEKVNSQIRMEVVVNDFTVKPIKVFPAYLEQGNNILGIPLNAKGQADLEPVFVVVVIDEEAFQSVFDSFFILGGKIYFKVSRSFPVEESEPEIIIKYCVQENQEIKYLTESKFPDVPESARIEAVEGDYEFSIGDYKGQEISIAKRDYSETLIFIDGFLVINGGCLINAKIGRGSARPDGLLFWPDNKQNMDHWKGYGRFWK